MPTTLLKLTDPKYQRRMAAALRHRDHGFYMGGLRYIQAEFSGGAIRVRSVSGERWTRIADISSTIFTDSVGKEIVVSRVP